MNVVMTRPMLCYPVPSTKARNPTPSSRLLLEHLLDHDELWRLNDRNREWTIQLCTDLHADFPMRQGSNQEPNANHVNETFANTRIFEETTQACYRQRLDVLRVNTDGETVGNMLRTVMAIEEELQGQVGRSNLGLRANRIDERLQVDCWLHRKTLQLRCRVKSKLDGIPDSRVRIARRKRNIAAAECALAKTFAESMKTLMSACKSSSVSVVDRRGKTA